MSLTMDGFEVVNRLADTDMPKDVPILIVTGHELTAADRARLNGKVADIMQKNGDPRPALGDWLRRAAAASGRRGAAAGEVTVGSRLRAPRRIAPGVLLPRWHAPGSALRP